MLCGSGRDALKRIPVGFVAARTSTNATSYLRHLTNKRSAPCRAGTWAVAMPRARAAASASSSGGADVGASSTLALTDTAAATAAGSGGAASLVPSESTGMTPKLQNIVCTVTLGCPLDLKRITLHARNAEYNPKRCGKALRSLLQRRPVPLTTGAPA